MKMKILSLAVALLLGSAIGADTQSFADTQAEEPQIIRNDDGGLYVTIDYDPSAQCSNSTSGSNSGEIALLQSRITTLEG